MYKNSYFLKEIRQSNIEHKISAVNGTFFGIFTAMIAFLLHIAVLQLDGTVFADTFPYLLHKDFFAPLYIYEKTFILFCIVYYLVRFEHIALAEIRSNRWYLLVKMGYNPKILVTVKLFAQFSLLLYAFLIGYLATLGVALLSNCAYSSEYLPALFLSGVIGIALLCSLTTALSVLNRFRSVLYSRWCIVLAESAFILLSDLTGYRNALSSKTFIAEHGMFAPFSMSASVYFVLIMVCIAALYVVSLYNAKNIAMYYDEPLENTDFSLPAGRVLARIDHKTGVFYIFRKSRFKVRSIVFNIVIIVLLCAFVLFSLGLNIFYYCNRNGKFVKIDDYIFALSDKTLEPADFDELLIYKNDFLIFKTADVDDSIDEGKTVLIENDGKLEIKQYSTELQNTHILGELRAVSRWLGAAVLLVSNTEGKTLFLVLPLLALLLFGGIRKLLAKKPVPIE